VSPEQFSATVAEIADGADVVLPLLGQAELVPLVNLLATVINKVAIAVQAKSDTATAAAVMDSARKAADVAESLKFPKPPAPP